MRLHRLTLTAFGPFATRQTVDFDALCAAGLFLLHGPTGAGKTSVLDALCFALYGRVPGSREKFPGTLRSDHADPHTRTEVVLELTVGERRLEVTRAPEQPRPKRRGSGLTVDKPYALLREYHAERGEWRSLSRSHQEVGAEVQGLLGMSREQFCQVVLLPQNGFARFLRADAEARAQLLGRLFDTRRFAAAEQHLSELRRTTAERVRRGDTALLGLAHRIAQAAGDTTDLADHLAATPPDPDPGEPGLAHAVLGRAAVARVAARERLACAEAAVTAARLAHDDALGRREEVRSLAEAQRRHAQARQRAAELEQQRPEADRARRRLEVARAAEGVAPALALRERAEADHRAAVDADRRARRALPARWATAGAAHLATLEGEHRTRLGELAAARRAAERAREVDTARDALDRATRQDTVALTRIQQRLATWEAERDRLRRAVEDAQQAAAEAAELAGRVAGAQEALTAGVHRDQLAEEREAAAARLLDARERAAGAYEEWVALRERRLEQMAAELASGLVDGEPCAVCGAREHPEPARAEGERVDRAAEEAARLRHQEATVARDTAERTVQEVREAWAAADAAAGPRPVAELTATVTELRAAHQRAHTAAAGLPAARQALAHAEREHDERREEGRQLENRIAAAASRRETLREERAVLEATLAPFRGERGQARAPDGDPGTADPEPDPGGAARAGGLDDLDDRAARLQDTAALLAEAAEAARGVEEAARRLKDADAQVADTAYQAGFATPQAAAEAVLEATEQQAVAEWLERWRAEQAAVTATLADPQLTEAARRPAADEDTARHHAELADRRRRERDAAHAAARTRCAELDRLSADAEALAGQLAPHHAEHHLVSRLAGLTAGTSAENRHRMRLESYVLAARLEQVAAAANVRLARMSAGRYTLLHSDQRASGRGRHGLGLHVVDAWTGRERDTATLSGGETFFVSLALALGLADVVTDEAGGTRLDTLFVDEGFGSLDEQTLDEVLDLLDALRERDRSVGIVSHVAELRQRIPAQLEVRKHRAGSALRLRAPAAG